MRMLIAVDVDEKADRVVDEAAPWTERLGATADLVFVEEYGQLSSLIREPALRAQVEEEWNRLRESHHKKLDTLMQRIPEANRGESKVLAGSPHRVLVEASSDYDMIAIATHGRTGLSHLFMGSVAERVSRQAACSVLVLRLPGDDQ